MRKVIIIATLLLAGCGNPTLKVNPDKLPNASVGQLYSEEIYISGGALRKGNISVLFTPKNSGLTWKPKISYLVIGNTTQKNEDFHNITIHGTPRTTGKITIDVGGATLGTMYPGKRFDKTYEITVEE